MALGRPSKYSKELGSKICERLADGESLRAICESDEMPTKSTVLRWLFEDDKKEFSDQYARAREIQAELWADELNAIADDGTNDYMLKETANGSYVQLNTEAIGRSRLRIDTRKWIAAKLLPKKYGEKQTHELTGADGNALTINLVQYTDK